MDRIFNFGKYKGRKISDIAITNCSYIEWCLNNVQSFHLTKQEQRLYDKKETFVIKHPTLTVTLVPNIKRDKYDYDYVVHTKYTSGAIKSFRELMESPHEPNQKELIEEFFREKCVPPYVPKLDYCEGALRDTVTIYFKDPNYIPRLRKSWNKYEDVESCRKHLGGWLDPSDGSLACGFASDSDMF